MNESTILPLLISDDQPHWFLVLLEITKFVTARLTSPSVACYVAALVHHDHD